MRLHSGVALHNAVAVSAINAMWCCIQQVWDTEQCKCVHTLRGHKQPVQRIAICGSRLYSTAGRNIRVWDITTFECLQVIRTHQDCGALLAMTAAPDGTVYVGGQVCPCSLLPCIVNHSLLAACLSSKQLFVSCTFVVQPRCV